MQVRTRHTPTFGVARLVLAPAEPVLVERSSVLATSYGIGVDTKIKAPGVTAALCTAGPEGGWVDVAPPLPGDLHVLELDGATGWCVARDSWLAASATARLDPAAPPVRALHGGDHGFLAYASGSGPVVLSCYGTLDVVTLDAGELVTLAAGHVVAFADTLQCRLRAVSPDAPQSVRNGGGLALDFAGPGLVLTRTRSPRSLVTWLRDNGFSVRS
ncbi:AIM24 family protein [Saccharothrix longispora]|uniref:AIM24 family protein n=1 Tax=Saccharothrix longispora TaxID=33920 RepID=UPI0028FD86AA|nr:AIM24 family protein [Saccharothrix longispora]MBY8851871.1 AIM24 family protein [Saccharothrix sp. MB29]MDU0294630.1 AIM24 family protein [Saccharothrix longispora]